MAHVTLMTGPERRRRWRADERQEILAAAFAPGAVVADVARQYEVATSLIYQWRREARAACAAEFLPAVLVDDGGGAEPSGSAAAIVIDLPRGGRVSISRSAPPALVTAALRALR